MYACENIQNYICMYTRVNIFIYIEHIGICLGLLIPCEARDLAGLMEASLDCVVSSASLYWSPYFLAALRCFPSMGGNLDLRMHWWLCARVSVD